MVIGFVLYSLGPIPAACAGGPPRVDLRFLLVSGDGADPTLAAWRAQLVAEGVPYDLFLAQRRPALTESDLILGPGHGRYQAVVVAGPALHVQPDEFRTLAAYERDFGVRRVTSGTSPTFPYRPLSIDAVRAQLTSAGQKVFPYLRGGFDLEQALGIQARPAEYARARALVRIQGGRALVTEVAHSDGREELLVGVLLHPDRLHSLLLAHGFVRWAAHGPYLGTWGSYLSVQVDDVLLPNARWDPTTNESATGPLGRGLYTIDPIRMTPNDVERAARWSKRERFVLDFGVNGFGVGQDCDGLTRSITAHRRDFRWFNHTYSHLDLGRLSVAPIAAEISENVAWAMKRGVELDPGELVTGEHSGLENEALPTALGKTGIRFIASDASEPIASRRLGGARVVPRHPTELSFAAATRAEQVDNYNHVYYERCSSGLPCLDAPVAWTGFLDRESRRILGLVLSNDPRPHFTHQSNLAEDAIQLDLVSEVLRRYRAAVRAPLRQPTLTETGVLLERMERWHAALEAGEVAAYRQGAHVYLESKRHLLVPITGARHGDRYAGDRSGWIELEPGRLVRLAEDGTRG